MTSPKPPPRTGDTAITRLVRIESKLTRLLLNTGLDADGNLSEGMIPVRRELLDNAAECIDLYLTLLDNHHSAPEFDEQYDKAEAAHNQLVDARRSRCRSNSP